MAIPQDGPRIQELTATTGAGTLSLAGAPAGYTPFSTFVSNAGTVLYWLLDANGLQWEVGQGTYLASPPTLARTTVFKSSNNNTNIVLTSGNHVVMVAPVPGYATGNVNYQYATLAQAELQAYTETVANPVISAGGLTLDLNLSNVFDVSHNANITTLTLMHPPVAGKAASLTLRLTQDVTGGRTLTFPASVKWAGGTAPTLTTTAGKANVLNFFTLDGGTTYLGALIGKDYA